MKKAAPSLTSLVEEATYWSLSKGAIVATIESYDGQTVDKYVVSNDDLRKLHPLLPEAMEATILNAHRSHVVFFDGESQLHQRYIHDLLHILHGNYIEFVDTGGGLRQVIKLVSNIQEPTAEAVYIHGHYCETGKTQVNGIDVPYVMITTKKTREVTVQALEKNYPGWLVRLRLGKQLGVERDTLLSYVFAKAPPAADIEPLCDLAP